MAYAVFSPDSTQLFDEKDYFECFPLQGVYPLNDYRRTRAKTPIGEGK
jgi:hypothetical protein